MKKIAYICELAGTKRQGGEQHAMLRVADQLRKNGYIVDIFTYVADNLSLRINTWIPLKIRLLPFIRDMFVLPLIGPDILKKTEKNYDVVHSSSTTIAAFYKPKIKLITTCHIIRSQKFDTMSKIPKYKMLFNPLTYLIMSTLEKKSLLNVNKIIVLREHQKNFLIKEFNIPEKKIHIIPNGIDTELFKPLNIEKNKQAIFVGRGTVPKGLDKLLNIRNNIDGQLLIVTQKIDDELKKIVDSSKNVRVVYNANPSELVNLYAQSKVFVLPSLDEEQPLTVLEAMACGLPVVVSPKAASDVVSTRNGVIVDPRDTNGLSSALNSFLNNDEQSIWEQVNREIISNDYSLKNISMKTAQIYE